MDADGDANSRSFNARASAYSRIRPRPLPVPGRSGRLGTARATAGRKSAAGAVAGDARRYRAAAERRRGTQHRVDQRVHAGQWPAGIAVSRRQQADGHGQPHLRRGLGAGKLRRDRHGPPARASGVQGHAQAPGHQRRDEEARRRLQCHHLAGPHQLLRFVSGRRRRLGLGAGYGSRSHGQFQHRAEGPGQRDDRGPQRNGKRREQPGRRAVPAHPFDRVPVAQLRQHHHRRALGRRRRADRPAAGLLPHLVPAGQRDADHRRPHRSGADAGARGRAFRHAEEADPHAAALLHGRAAAGRRARGHGASRRRPAPGGRGLPHPRRRASGQRRAGRARQPAGPHARRAPAQGAGGDPASRRRRRQRRIAAQPGTAERGRGGAQGRRRGQGRSRADRAGRAAGAAPGYRTGGGRSQAAHRQRLRPVFHRRQCGRHGAVGVHRRRRLAPAVPHPRRGREGHRRGRQPRGGAVPEVQQPHPGPLRPHRHSRPRAGTGRARCRRAGAGLYRPRGGERGRELRPFAAEPAGAHRDLHPGRFAQSLAAAEEDPWRNRGGGRAVPFRRRRKPDRGAQSGGRPDRQHADARQPAADARADRPAPRSAENPGQRRRRPAVGDNRAAEPARAAARSAGARGRDPALPVFPRKRVRTAAGTGHHRAGGVAPRARQRRRAGAGAAFRSLAGRPPATPRPWTRRWPACGR